MFDSAYVVKVYGFPNLPDYGNCIVMEWVDGVTLKQWLHGDRGMDTCQIAMSVNG